MKRQLMKVLALCAGMTVLAAAGDTYEKGKVYGPISILGNESVEIDGNGAIIDGGGTNRCATLGPNVTLKNFTFRNGKAAVGGGVWGGKVMECAIHGCEAREYGAAVANCEVIATEITDCRVSLVSGETAAMQGGIVADSTLDGVTITGCHVEMGTDKPCFGGIAANSSLVGCTVTGNTLSISGDHYGLLFYGKSLVNSTIKGNSVDSSTNNVAAFMKVTMAGCSLDGDGPTPPGPTPPDPPVESAFVGNAKYAGYLLHNGVVCGTISIAAAAPKYDMSSVSISIQPLGGKKTTARESVEVGGCPTVDGLTYTSSGVSGTIAVDGVQYEAATVADALTSPDSGVKAAAKLHVPAGTWTFAWADERGVETCFSVAVAAKTGKAKVTGVLPNGKKVTVTAASAMDGDFKTLSIPVAYSKSGISFAFLLEVDIATRAMRLTRLSVPNVEVFGPLPLDGAESRVYGFHCSLEGSKYLREVEGMDPGETVNVSPAGVAVTVFGGKWTVEKSVGSVKLGDGYVYVKYDTKRQEPANVAKLKLQWAYKTGIVSGSFKLYYLEGGRIKTETATVSGVTVGKEMHGTAFAKKAAVTFPATLVPAGQQ